MQSELRKEDSDSEDDPDYIPPAQGNLDGNIPKGTDANMVV